MDDHKIENNPALTKENSGHQAVPQDKDQTEAVGEGEKPGGEAGTGEAGEDTPTSTKFTYHQKATFVSAMLAILANLMAFSIISIFYPIEVQI